MLRIDKKLKRKPWLRTVAKDDGYNRCGSGYAFSEYDKPQHYIHINNDYQITFDSENEIDCLIQRLINLKSLIRRP